METKEKVFTYGAIFLLFAAIIAVGTVAALRDKDKVITELKITGADLLNTDDYLEFTGFTSNKSFENLKLSVIKARFDSHPYIKYADVKRNADNSVSVEITEKTVLAQIINDKSLYLVTDKRELLKLLNGTTRVDYPVISNLPDSILTTRDTIKFEKELKLAVNIVNAIKTAGESKIKLAEVDLRKGNEIIVHLENIAAFVKFGRGNYSAKIVSLVNAVLNERTKSRIDNALYVDVRYSNRIYIGNYEENKVAI